MKVWIVNPFDNLPPEGNRPQRYWLLARAFARAGHEVTLWTCDFSHARKAPRRFAGSGVEARTTTEPGFSRAEFTADEAASFRVVMIGVPGYPRNICLRRILSHRAFARRWLRAAEAEKVCPDVLVTSLPPLALGDAARRFRLRTDRMRWIVDVQDAWPETFERVVPRWMLAPLRRVARRVYRAADGIVGVAERYVDLARAYGATAPMRVFPLAIELGKGVEVENAPKGGFRLAYAGNMGASYDLATVIASVKGRGDVELDLAGTGPDEAGLRALAADCPRIRFHGYLADAALRGLLASCSAAVIPMFDAACVGVPGKLADYAAAGLPVLNSLHGETERLLADAGAGFTYTAGDGASFLAALDRLRAVDAEGLRAGVRTIAARFDADRVYGAYADWVFANMV